MVQDPAAYRQRGRGRLPLALVCLACVFLDTHGETGTDEHRCKFLPWNDRTEAVQGNVSMLKLKRAGGSETGWFAELDARFSREPPLYADGDGSIVVECSLTLHPGAQAERKPPVPVGRRLKLRASLNGVAGLEVELLPLVAINDGIASMMSFQHIIVGMDMLQDRNTGARCCHGPVVIRGHSAVS